MLGHQAYSYMDQVSSVSTLANGLSAFQTVLAFPGYHLGAVNKLRDKKRFFFQG
jgi:hypothetical protein